MAIITNIQITQTPQITFDEAYGPLPVTIEGIPYDDTTGIIQAEKYVLQIWRNGQMIADLRQSPNASAAAIFDIQNTIQNFVSPSPNNVEEIGFIGVELMNSAKESTPYELRASYEQGGQVPAYPGTTGQWATSNTLLAFGGTKEYYEVPFNATAYIPQLTQTGICTGVLKPAKPFTDLTSYRLGGAITDGKPSWLTSNIRVYDHYVTRDDMTTISYYQMVSGPNPPALAASVDAIMYWQFDANGQPINSGGIPDLVYNVQANGGGPNTTPGQGAGPIYPYRAVTAATGPRNFQDLSGLCTHYYVSTSAYTDSACPTLVSGLTNESMHYVHRFNIIESNCSDFPDYQFSWLNSYGFRDYYSFRKRHDRSVSINRNEFLREAANYNSTEYSVDRFDRGQTVYSQTLQQDYVAFTDYLSDEDAKYLEGLFTSADVKVRFGDAEGNAKYEWTPVVITSTNWREKTIRTDRLFQYDIRFKQAHNLKSQRG